MSAAPVDRSYGKFYGNMCARYGKAHVDVALASYKADGWQTQWGDLKSNVDYPIDDNLALRLNMYIKQLFEEKGTQTTVRPAADRTARPIRSQSQGSQQKGASLISHSSPALVSSAGTIARPLTPPAIPRPATPPPPVSVPVESARPGSPRGRSPVRSKPEPLIQRPATPPPFSPPVESARPASSRARSPERSQPESIIQRPASDGTTESCTNCGRGLAAVAVAVAGIALAIYKYT